MKLLLLFATVALATPIQFSKNIIYQHVCPIDTPLTCSNNTEIPDTCCFEYPGGIFLATQFWDYHVPSYLPHNREYSWEELEPHLGPNNSFTCHGLWPDNCDGSYEQFCSKKLEIDDVKSLLSQKQFNDGSDEISGKHLLAQMQKFWKSNNGKDESLWIHEWNKHGTCIKTMKEECYLEYKQDEPVYDYFRIAMEIFKNLDTFKMLEKHGIVPSETKVYTRQEISDALREEFGHEVYFKCDRNQALNEIWYYHLLQGSILSQNFIGVDSFKTFSNCPLRNIKFLPKGYNKSPSRPGNPGGKPGKRGHVMLSGQPGCLIRNGHWYSSGTCATFFLEDAEFGNFLLRGASGYCALDGNTLVCNRSKNRGSQFEFDGTYLGYSGVYDWYATEYPRGRRQAVVHNGIAEDVNEYGFKLKFA